MSRVTYYPAGQREARDHGLIKFDLIFDGDSIKGTASGQMPDGTKVTAKVDLKRAE
jgi:hypothetical protein